MHNTTEKGLFKKNFDGFHGLVSNKRVAFFSLLLLFTIGITGSVYLASRQTNLSQHASALDSVKVEAETANFTGSASVISDTTASGGKAILLNGTTVTSPTDVPAGVTTALTPTITPQQASNGKLGWSTGYYVGWLQGTYPPQVIPWKAITVLNQFSLMSSSARDGSITIAHGLTSAYMQAAVSAAHAHNVKILVSIGGAEDNNFDAACNATNRAKFTNNLITMMKTYGYDGIDLDIEQDFGSPNHTDYIACVTSIKNALDAISPRPLLTAAADPDWQAYMIAPVWQDFDQINLMTYWVSYTGIAAKLTNYTNLGIPKSKLGIGLGLGDGGGVDTTAANCGGKAQYAINNGYGGIMEWIITDDQSTHNGQTPCLDAVTPYIQ